MSFSWPSGYLEYCKEWEAKIGAFIGFDGARAESEGGDEAARGPLAGLPFAVKDNIAVKGMPVSCGSKLLENVQSPYTATAVEKLEALGAKVAGKTNLDEFGMGSSTDNSALKQTNNPWDTSRVAGGSSGGSAAAVSAGLVPFALGSDTGGSIRQPAAFCGVVGLKPTYGAVSRFGLVAYASSLEGIGVLADTTARCRDVFAAIRGRDGKDQTSRDAPVAAPELGAATGKKRAIGVLSAAAIAKAIAAAAADETARRAGAAAGGASGTDGSAAEGQLSAGSEGLSDLPAGLSAGQLALEIAAQAATLEEEVRAGFEKAKAGLAALGHTLVDVEIPALKYGVPAYYTIATAEASANLARFDGVRYGKRPDWAENPDDLIDKSRGAGFGDEVKLRILLGTFVLRSGFQDRYYLRAQRIRSGIRQSFEQLLGNAGYSDAA
jgi:aspartyl-tRNA(Asn)/glutamyl-tRNA(Gln) amidotransferase subunit A